MSYPINQRFNPNQQLAMGVNTPQVQNVNVDTLAQNSALKGVSGDQEDNLLSKKTFLLSLPVAAVMSVGMDKFNKSCGGKYEESILGKVAKIGSSLDKKIAKYPTLEKIGGKIANGIKLLDEKVVSKSRILSAFIHAPSKPVSHSVLTMATGTKAELAGDAIDKLLSHLTNGGKLFAADGSVLNADLMKKHLEDLKNKNSAEETINEIVQICKNQKGASTEARQVLSLKWVRKIPFVGNLLGDKQYLSEIIPQLKILGREIHFSEYVNKIEIFTNSPKNVKFFGRNLPKFMVRVLEGLTNGTAGGKLAVFMGAYFVADAIKKTMEAPKKKGEKRKVFAENMISNVGMYMTMPASIVLMHKFGGLQYAGMGKGKTEIQAELKKYRAALEEFNKKAENRLFRSIDDYKAEIKKIKSMKKGDTELAKAKGAFGKIKTSLFNIVLKPIKALTTVGTVGLETFKPYLPQNGGKLENFIGKIGFSSEKASKIGKFIREIPFKLKGKAGYPMRFGIFMFLIAPFFGDILAKGSHIIFGRPQKSILDVGKEPSEKKEAKPLIIPQQNPVSQQPQQNVIQPVQQNSGLANNQFNKQVSENLVGNNSNSREMIPPSEPTGRRYIPSESGVQIIHSSEINEAKENEIKKAQLKANYAEAAAGKYIKTN